MPFAPTTGQNLAGNGYIFDPNPADFVGGFFLRTFRMEWHHGYKYHFQRESGRTEIPAYFPSPNTTTANFQQNYIAQRRNIP